MTKKFRIWDKELKIYTEHAEFADGILEDILLHPKGGFLLILDNGLTKVLDNDRFILEQFTGLLDSEGKEIYEGDILKWEKGENFSQVIFLNGSFMVQGINWGAFWYLSDYSQSYKIIGDIHQNPELLA